jgi:thioredoxin 1
MSIKRGDMDKVLLVNEKTFEQTILGAKSPVVVDFWAPWCSPCRPVGSIMEELAEEYGDKITFAKINVDENIKLANQYGVHSIPTILIFKNGQPQQQMIGLRPKKEFKEILAQFASDKDKKL